MLPSTFTDIPPRELSSTFGFYPVRGPPRHRREKHDTLVAMKSSIEYKSRGALVGRTTQRWVEATGRRVALERVDERGYVSSRKLHMGCEAAVYRTPLGARIVAGRHSLNEPQYAWDYASLQLAAKALVYAEFNTHPMEGIIGVEDPGRGLYPAAEPKEYLRRWRYSPERRMEKF